MTIEQTGRGRGRILGAARALALGGVALGSLGFGACDGGADDGPGLRADAGQARSGAVSACFEASPDFCAAFGRSGDPFAAAGVNPDTFRGETRPDSRPCLRQYEALCAGCPAWRAEDCAALPGGLLRDPAAGDAEGRGRVLSGAAEADYALCWQHFQAECAPLIAQRCPGPDPNRCAAVAAGDTDRFGDCAAHLATACAEDCAARYPSGSGRAYCEDRIEPACAEHVAAICAAAGLPEGCHPATDAFCAGWRAAGPAAGGQGGHLDPAVSQRPACQAHYQARCDQCPELEVAACEWFPQFAQFVLAGQASPGMPAGLQALAALPAAERARCAAPYQAGACAEQVNAACGAPDDATCAAYWDRIESGDESNFPCRLTHNFACGTPCLVPADQQAAVCIPVLGGDASAVAPAWCEAVVRAQCTQYRQEYCTATYADGLTFNRCARGVGVEPFCAEVVAGLCEGAREGLCDYSAVNLSTCGEGNAPAQHAERWNDPFCQDGYRARCVGLFVDVCPPADAFSCAHRDRLHPGCRGFLDAACGANWAEVYCAAPRPITPATCGAVEDLIALIDDTEAACREWVLGQCAESVRAFADAQAAAEGSCFGTVVAPTPEAQDRAFSETGGVASVRDLFDCVPFAPGALDATQASWAQSPDVNSCDEYVFARYFTFERYRAAIAPFRHDAGLAFDAATSPLPAHADFAFARPNAPGFRRQNGQPSRRNQDLLQFAQYPDPVNLGVILSEASDTFFAPDRDRNDLVTVLREDPDFRAALGAYRPGGPVGNPVADAPYLLRTAEALGRAADPSHQRARREMTLRHARFLGDWLRRRNRMPECDDDLDGACGRAAPANRPLHTDEALAWWYQRRKRFEQLHALWRDTPCRIERVNNAWTACGQLRRTFLHEARQILIEADVQDCFAPTDGVQVSFEGDFYHPARICDWAPQDFLDDIERRMEGKQAAARDACERYAHLGPGPVQTLRKLDQELETPIGRVFQMLDVAVPIDPRTEIDLFEMAMYLVWLRGENAAAWTRFRIGLQQLQVSQATQAAIERVDGLPANRKPKWSEHRSKSVEFGNRARLAGGHRSGSTWRLYPPPGGVLGLENEALCQTNVTARTSLGVYTFIFNQPHFVYDAAVEVNAREGQALTTMRVAGFNVFNQNQRAPGDFDWNLAFDGEETAAADHARDISVFSIAGLSVFMRVGVRATAGIEYDVEGTYQVDPVACANAPLELRARLDARPFVRGSTFLEAGFDFLLLSVGVGGELDLLDVRAPTRLDLHVEGPNAYDAVVDANHAMDLEYRTMSGRLYLTASTFFKTWRKTFVRWSGRRFIHPVGARGFSLPLGAIYDYCRTSPEGTCDD